MCFKIKNNDFNYESNLEIYMRMSDLLIKRIYPVLKNFPKFERYSLTSDIKKYFFNYLNYVSRASKVKSKRLEYAQEAESELQNIKLAITVAYSEKYISKGFYKSVSEELTNVSKMLNSYIRSSVKK